MSSNYIDYAQTAIDAARDAAYAAYELEDRDATMAALARAEQAEQAAAEQAEQAEQAAGSDIHRHSIAAGAHNILAVAREHAQLARDAVAYVTSI